MRAAVIHGVMETLAGSERVAISIVRALASMGFDVDLLMASGSPKDFMNMLKDIGKVSIRTLSPFRIPGMGIYQRLLTYILSPKIKADLVVSAHGDLLPYRSYSGVPAIHYCHYPLAVIPRDRVLLGKYASPPWRLYYELYRVFSKPLARRAAGEGIIVTNSRYIAKLIRASLGIESHVIYPPVDVEKFLKIPLDLERENSILMIGRYSPEKGYEDAIKLIASMPREIKLWIVGILTRTGISYYRTLQRLAEKIGVEKRVELLYNIPDDKMIELMSRSSIFLHMYRGEHFGIAVVEAMAAGLIPIVWQFGGPSEYVPAEYQFKDLEEAREKIMKALNPPTIERIRMRKIAMGFSENVFIEKFRRVVNIAIKGLNM